MQYKYVHGLLFLIIPGIGQARPRCPLYAVPDHTDHNNILVSQGQAFSEFLGSTTPLDIQKSPVSLLSSVMS